MIPPVLKSARVRLPVLVALVATAASALVGCGPRETAIVEPGASLTASPSPSPSDSASPSDSPTPSVSPSKTAGNSSNTSSSGKDFAWYAARLPHFDPLPAPVPVTITPKAAGMAAFVDSLPSVTQPVAFLTIDDGATRNPMARDLIAAAKIPVTLFLTTNYVGGHQDYFKALQDTGYANIQNHTVSHPDLRTLADSGKAELCTASDNLASWFGTRPTLFRPPYGYQNDSVLRAAASCGLQAGFYWTETVDQGFIQYQRDAGHIHKGDIILMHFRTAFPDDFLNALRAIKDAGLTPALLQDYVQVGSPAA